VADPEVAATRGNRSTIEYFFTCTPAWMLFVLKREPGAEWVTYLDGDLYFFQSPEAIYDEVCDASVAIIPHRFTTKLAKLRKYGTYNVGWVGARNDPDGVAVIGWWREKCIEWCHDYVDGTRFADQGYLDSFAGLSARVKAIDNIGANLAPWNIGNYRIDFRDSRIMLDVDHPLIFFHFQGVKKALRWFIFNHHRAHRAPFSSGVRNQIYKPYLEELVAVEKSVAAVMPMPEARPYRRLAVIDFRQYLRSKLRNLAVRMVQFVDIVTGRAFFVWRGKLH
jgi:hypothetical protein